VIGAHAEACGKYVTEYGYGLDPVITRISLRVAVASLAIGRSPSRTAVYIAQPH
jgi:hypothetical protein